MTALALALLLLARTSPPPPGADAVAKVESAFGAQNGGRERNSYARWYWTDPDDPAVIDGLYLAPTIAPELGGGGGGP